VSFADLAIPTPTSRTFALAAKNDQCTGGELMVYPAKSNGMAELAKEVNCFIVAVGE
jgi:hypothetical protein